MGQFDRPLFDSGFASGLVYYEDQYPGQDPTARIILTITIAGLHTVPAIVDTGAPWCLLDADILAEIEPDHVDSLPTERLAIRGVSYHGRLIRLMVSLRADVGEDVDLEATVFIPILNPDETWNVPNFIGLQGLLSRIRFAVDPAENIFFFGPTQSELLCRLAYYPLPDAGATRLAAVCGQPCRTLILLASWQHSESFLITPNRSDLAQMIPTFFAALEWARKRHTDRTNTEHVHPFHTGLHTPRIANSRALDD